MILIIDEIMELGLWEKFCDLRGWDYYIVSDGKASGDEEIILNEHEVKKLGLKDYRGEK